MTFRPVSRALLSVSDKTGLVELGRALVDLGVTLISTGGTAASLAAAGLPVTEVAEITGFPEIMDGRVKTLHPKIHGGLLARRESQEHLDAMRAHGIDAIDLLVVNLYPFEATLARGGCFEECLENVDIGGPAMLRAAAKNHDGVVVVVDPRDYPALLIELRRKRGTDLAFRRRLSAKAFGLTSAYDAAVAGWLATSLGERFPERLTFSGERSMTLRYGENPHQAAALYRTSERRPGVTTAEQLQGKELSYNNILDTDAALECVAELEEPAVVIVKHANPCGVATAATTLDAWHLALACDPVSAFGGIVALDRLLDGPTAAAIAQIFTEVVIAPAVSDEARKVFAAKKNLRLLVTGAMPSGAADALTVRSVAGGLLVQDRDVARITPDQLRVVTRRAPSPDELGDLLFAWKVVRHVKSNAIVLARGGATVGIGMGQTNRLDSVRNAAERMRAGPGAGPAALASEAFFPFADGLQAAIEAGVTACIQPGGAMRDEEVIAAADAAGIAMVFTGRRHFRH